MFWRSLVPRLRVPPGEKHSGERSWISWAYYPNVVMTNNYQSWNLIVHYHVWVISPRNLTLFGLQFLLTLFPTPYWGKPCTVRKYNTCCNLIGSNYWGKPCTVRKYNTCCHPIGPNYWGKPCTVRKYKTCCHPIGPNYLLHCIAV